MLSAIQVARNARDAARRAEADQQLYDAVGAYEDSVRLAREFARRQAVEVRTGVEQEEPTMTERLDNSLNEIGR
jgi:hypothetical protein